MLLWAGIPIIHAGPVLTGSSLEKQSAPAIIAPPPPALNGIPRSPLPYKPEASLFNCNDCNPDHRGWYSDVNQLKQSAYYCGFDYCAVRITQSFAVDTLRGRLTVYAHSLADNTLDVDSAATALRSPSADEAIVTVYHKYPRSPFPLPLPSLFPPTTDYSGKIDAIVNRTGSFQSFCGVRNTALQSVWNFTLNGVSYLIEKGRLITGPAPIGLEGNSAGSIEYRLESWGTTPQSASVHRSEHAVPPEIRSFEVNDSVSICRVHLEAASRYGLQRCIVSCGAHIDTFNFSGEKHRNEHFTLDALPDDSLLHIRVDDIYGNSSLERLTLFTAQRKERLKRAEQRTVELLTKERAIGNPVAAAAYLISRFTGNPVSWLAREVLTRDAKSVLAATSDFYPERPPNEITFPFSGTIHNNLFNRASASYATRLFADEITLNGTQIAVLSNPTLRRTNRQQDCCSFNLKAPLIAGKYPSSWAVDTSGNNMPSGDGSSLLLCTAASGSRSGIVTLYDIPCILSRPEKQTDFTLYHSTADTAADTLTFTYCIRYADRTSEFVYQQFGIGPGGVFSAPGTGTTIVRTTPQLFINRAGEQCFLLNVSVQGEKKIFRVDAFVHSFIRNQVVGWGVASCPG